MWATKIRIYWSQKFSFITAVIRIYNHSLAANYCLFIIIS